MVSVDGKLYKGSSLDALVRDLRGKAGETVTLAILRGDATSRVPVTRAAVALDAVRRVSLGEGVEYVRVREMSEKTTPLLRAALEAARASKARAIVLDLRANPGGLFEEAVAAAGLFLPAGAPVVRVQKRGEPEEVRVASGAVVADLPLAVLVDHRTASAPSSWRRRSATAAGRPSWAPAPSGSGACRRSRSCPTATASASR